MKKTFSDTFGILAGPQTTREVSESTMASFDEVSKKVRLAESTEASKCFSYLLYFSYFLVKEATNKTFHRLSP